MLTTLGSSKELKKQLQIVKRKPVHLLIKTILVLGLLCTSIKVKMQDLLEISRFQVDMINQIHPNQISINGHK